MARASRESNCKQAGLAARNALCCGRSSLCMKQKSLRLLQENCSCWSQCDGSPCTKEKLHAQIVFQQLDLPAERRLRHMQALSRAAKVQLFANCHKATELFEVKH